MCVSWRSPAVLLQGRGGVALHGGGEVVLAVLAVGRELVLTDLRHLSPVAAVVPNATASVKTIDTLVRFGILENSDLICSKWCWRRQA